jgi:hypothetical protein
VSPDIRIPGHRPVLVGNARGCQFALWTRATLSGMLAQAPNNETNINRTQNQTPININRNQSPFNAARRP